MKNLLICFLFSFISTLTFSQTGIYRTYKDYKEGTLEKAGEFKNYSHIGGYIFIQDGKKVKYLGKEMWGFKYNNFLFRIDSTNYYTPVYVMHVGKKIVLYENGLNQIKRIRENTLNSDVVGQPSIGFPYYFSTDLKDEVIPAATPTGAYGKQRKRLRNFVEQHPECNPLFNCMDGNYYTEIPGCYYDFEGVKR